MAETLTRIALSFTPGHLNHYLRFGEPDRRMALDRRRALAFFRPGRTFGYVRWRANAYGTQDWRFAVAVSAAPPRRVQRMPGVRPGAILLLRVAGTARVRRALAAIDALEQAGFDPALVSPAYYRGLHHRLASGRPVRPYGEAQHAAHLVALRASA